MKDSTSGKPRVRVVGYTRVSTDEQAADGVSLDAQCAKIAAFCSVHELELVGIQEDAGVSGKSLDRPALIAALSLLDRGDAAGLVVAKLDRLSRSVRDLGALIEGYFGPDCARQGGPARLLSAADSIDTASAGGRLVLYVLMSVAQWERETIAERTRDALHHKRLRGERIGSIPMGARVASDGRTLEPEPGELATLSRAADLRARGLSLRAIAEALHAEGHRARSGGRFALSTHSRALRPQPQEPRHAPGKEVEP